MIHIRRSQKFDTAYRKLTYVERESVNATLDVFLDDPEHPMLDNHPLENAMEGARSIKAGVDLCIIFKVKGAYAEVILLNVGSHADVYVR